jgi:hypothetical protein
LAPDTFVDLHGATCLHCGHRTAAAVCPRCDVITAVGPAVPVDTSTIRVGYIGRGGTAAPALWVAAASATTGGGSSIYVADGRVLDPASTDHIGFVGVEGLESIRCDVAAALVTAAVDVWDSGPTSQLEANLIADRLGGDVARARRTACELAAAGRPASISSLPLSRSEVTWWTGLAYLRCGQRAEAVAMFSELPVNGYAVVAQMLRWASERWVGDAASTARFVLGRRLQGTPTRRLTLVSIACGATALEKFLLDPSAPLPDSLRSVPKIKPTIARALALRGATIAGALDVGPSIGHVVLDDLIDLGTALDQSTMSVEQIRQLVSRTHPESLSDHDVDVLELHFERDRRRLQRGRLDDIDVTRCDPHVRGVVTLLTDGAVTDELHRIDPPRARRLEDFLAAPSVANLSADLISDPSLWELIADHLDVPLWNWNTDLEPAMQCFAGWLALRACFGHLVTGDWAEALEAGQHAHRLAGNDAQRREALNLTAFAHWQVDDAEAARDTLVAAIGGADDVTLQVNLAIVTSSLDEASAATQLAGLIRDSASAELRAAAAMRAVHLFGADDLPWTAQRTNILPTALTAGLREYVVGPIDLGVFRSILGLQSNLDRQWLAHPANLSASPHRTTIEARVYQSRAAGPREFVEALGSALKSGHPAAWATLERDRAIEIAARCVFDDDGSSALFALFAVQRKLPIEPAQRVLLAPLAVLAICEQNDDEDGPPADIYTRLLADAESSRRDIRTSPRIDHLMNVAWDRLAQAHVRYLDGVVERMRRAVSDLERRVRIDARSRRNVQGLRSALEPIIDDAVAADDVLSEFRPHVSGTLVGRDIDDLLYTVREIRRTAMRMM